MNYLLTVALRQCDGFARCHFDGGCLATVANQSATSGSGRPGLDSGFEQGTWRQISIEHGVRFRNQFQLDRRPTGSESTSAYHGCTRTVPG